MPYVRRDRRRMSDPTPQKPPRENPILYAWRRVNPGRAIPPELLADGGGAVVEMLEQREKPGKFWP